jgi:hypothetical protein
VTRKKTVRPNGTIRVQVLSRGEGALPKDKRIDARGGSRALASWYRTYADAMRAFAVRLEAPEIRDKLLEVADRFSRKAASLDSVARLH